MSSPSRRILVVTYPYPPMPSVGGNRWLAMAKYLRLRGHEVTILTTGAFGSMPGDRSQDVHRAHDLSADTWLRAALRRPPLPVDGSPAPVDTPPPKMITSAFVPDHNVVTWIPFATIAALRLHAARHFDCIISTSAYESTHVVPLMMGARRPAWIADFRDGWTFHPWKPTYPLALQTRLDEHLETKVVRTAQRVVVVERPVGLDFQDRLGVNAAYIPNGWDPELGSGTNRAEEFALPEDRTILVHTGKLTGEWGRTPAPLFEAMRELISEQPELAQELLLVLAGRLDSREQEMISGAGLGGSVLHLGQLSREASLALQRRANALLVLTSASLPWEMPGKVFEYFGARRPILALAANNEAARVVAETRTGICVHPDDVGAIKRSLIRLITGGMDDYDPVGLERYTYPAPAIKIAAEIEMSIVDKQSKVRLEP